MDLNVTLHDNAPVPVGEATPLQSDIMVWITSIEFHQLAGMSKRSARKVLERAATGHLWRNHALEVRTVEGRGGNAGRSYQVALDSLPSALQIKWLELHRTAQTPAPKLIPLPMPDTIDPNAAKRQAEIEWKARILSPIVAHPKHSVARGEALRAAAGKRHQGLDGTPKRIAETTIRNWIRELEASGYDPNVLARKPRVETQPRRTLVCRAWDKACPLPDQTKAQIDATMDRYIRGLWASGPMSISRAETLASSKLLELSREAGWSGASPEACRVGEYPVKARKNAAIVAIYEHDAKRFSDDYSPRIRRSREGLKPMDIIVGDVHPIDVLVERDDGTIATPRLIGWLDLATNDLHCTLVLLPKGRGVTQAHVAEAFARLVEDWGLPRKLYLDNGSEYSWDDMMDGFHQLSSMMEAFDTMLAAPNDVTDVIDPTVDSSRAVTRALPYNASAKAIEGIFSALEKHLSVLPGYIGGDRMNKRTHKVGKAPRTYPGTWDDFVRTFHETILVYYRNMPQRGSLGGRSPNQVRAQFNADGHQSYTAPRTALVFAFSSVERPMVRTGGIEVGGIWYRHDDMVRVTGQRISVRFAKWAPDFVIWMRDGGGITIIDKAPTFQIMDPAGAIEQGRLAGIQRAYVRAEKAAAEKLDLAVEMARHVTNHCEVTPVMKGAEVALSPEQQAAVSKADQSRSPQAPRRLLPGEMFDPTTGEILSPKEAPTVESIESTEPTDIAALLAAAHQNDDKKKSDEAATSPDFHQLMIARYGNG